jgi:Tol biopolymer transport system component
MMSLRLFRLAFLLITVKILLTFIVIGAGAFLLVGPQVTYVSKYAVDDWEIQLMDINRGLAANLTQTLPADRARYRLPAWSPDGRQMALVASVGGQTLIIVLDFATGTARFLNQAGVDETDPAWAPDGSNRIAYSTFNGTDWDVRVRDVARSPRYFIQQNHPLATLPADERRPIWSPDGRHLAYVASGDGESDIYLASRSLPQRLTVGLRVDNDGLTWSPGGSHLAFVSRANGNAEIYSVNVETGAILNLSRHPGEDIEPTWSPDGNQLVFVSDRDGDDDLYTMTPAGDDVRQLTINLYPDYAPRWSPDGEQLLFVGVPLFNSEIFLIDADGSGLRRLTFDWIDDWNPVWRP